MLPQPEVGPAAEPHLSGGAWPYAAAQGEWAAGPAASQEQGRGGGFAGGPGKDHLCHTIQSSASLLLPVQVRSVNCELIVHYVCINRYITNMRLSEVLL